MISAKSFSTGYADACGFFIFSFFHAVVTFHHDITLIVLLKCFMAGHAKHFFPVLDIFIITGDSHSTFQFYTVFTFPHRCFLLHMMFFTNSSPADYADTHSIAIFSIFCTFIAFHDNHSYQKSSIHKRFPYHSYFFRPANGLKGNDSKTP